MVLATKILTYVESFNQLKRENQLCCKCTKRINNYGKDFDVFDDS